MSDPKKPMKQIPTITHASGAISGADSVKLPAIHTPRPFATVVAAEAALASSS